MGHATGEEECFPSRLVFRAENDALIVLRRGEPLLALDRVLDATHQPDRFYRTAEPGPCKIPPSRLRPYKRGHQNNRQREGNDRYRHPEKYQQ